MSENNNDYFDVYDNQDANDLQDNGHDSNQTDPNEQDDQVSFFFKVFFNHTILKSIIGSNSN
jgi:hypothetical protein